MEMGWEREKERERERQNGPTIYGRRLKSIERTVESVVVWYVDVILEEFSDDMASSDDGSGNVALKFILLSFVFGEEFFSAWVGRFDAFLLS